MACHGPVDDPRRALLFNVHVVDTLGDLAPGVVQAPALLPVRLFKDRRTRDGLEPLVDGDGRRGIPDDPERVGIAVAVVGRLKQGVTLPDVALDELAQGALILVEGAHEGRPALMHILLKAPEVGREMAHKLEDVVDGIVGALLAQRLRAAAQDVVVELGLRFGDARFKRGEALLVIGRKENRGTLDLVHEGPHARRPKNRLSRGKAVDHLHGLDGV